MLVFCWFQNLVNPVNPVQKPAVRASHENVNEDNFDGRFRYWEIRRIGVSEEIIKILQVS